MSYYWISKQKNFGRNVKYGDEIKGLPGDLTKEEEKERFKDLLGKGLVSDKKPENVTSSEKNKIVEIQAVNEELREELEELKDKARKGGSVKLKEAREKISKLEAELKTANGSAEIEELHKELKESFDKNIELESQLEEATKPKDDK